MSAGIAIQAFVALQKRLLECELRAEEEGTMKDPKSNEDEHSGFFIRNVELVDTSVGLYGRTILSFGHAVAPDLQGINKGDVAKQKSFRPLLEAHRFTVGDEVEILPKNGKGVIMSTSLKAKKMKQKCGVICAMDEYTISVALFGVNSDKKQHLSTKKDNPKTHGKKIQHDKIEEEADDSDILDGSPPYCLVPKSNVEVHQKMIAALEELEMEGVSHPIAGKIIHSAFEANHTSFVRDELSNERVEQLGREFNIQTAKLDYSQRDAVVFALHSNFPITLIHGPPGTGKTTTVAELIRCAVHHKNWKVLVTAPSNVAVDNVLERLTTIENEGKTSKKSSHTKLKAVRLGHPARIQQGIRKYSLESLVESSEGTDIVRDCRREMNNHLKTLSNSKLHSAEKRTAVQEIKLLRKEIRVREEKVVCEILRDANVVLATNIGAASSIFDRIVDRNGEPISFDLVIIDEAAQALEASCWISLLRGKRAVLAGDHKQLPPTIKCLSRDVQRELGKTLFERLMESYESTESEVPSKRSTMLKVQYRMHEDIANWASNAMYGGMLSSHESVRNRKLSDLPRIKDRFITKTCTDSFQDSQLHNTKLDNVTLTLIDTTGCDFYEMSSCNGSRCNEGEADLVVSHVHSLLSFGLNAEDIAVITPYNGQVELLRKKLLPEIPKLEIRSVDGFQGGEREAVILSLVRSKEPRASSGIGFLKDERRLNVAVTRAKRHCALICNCETVSQSKFIKGLIEWMEQKGEYHSGAEFLSTHETNSTLPPNINVIPVPATMSSKKQKHRIDNKKPVFPKRSDPVRTQVGTSRSSSAIAHAKSDSKVAVQPVLQNDVASREELTQRIASFSECGKMTAELVFNQTLLNFDADVVRELAEKIGLGCQDSDGDSQILTIYKKNETTFNSNIKAAEHKVQLSKLSQLVVDDDESSESSDHNEKRNTASNGFVYQNDLLNDLAAERKKRIEIKKQEAVSSSVNHSKTKVGIKKDGLKHSDGKCSRHISKEEEHLDDMAFLDAQIEKVQSSHGRKIEGDGKMYRSIVNGVLLHRKSPHEVRRTNSVASNHLKAKIKGMAEDRQVKMKKGK